MIRPYFTFDLNDELIVDNFAGGGGASLGIAMALGREVDIAINHDAQAVALHRANHPQTKHFCEDVFKIDPDLVTNGRRVGLAWFSPDCKHFSKAKGGKPKSKKIRGLAKVVFKWTKSKTAKPRIIILENVEEFQDWGPLGLDGQPCPRRKGRTFAAFVRKLRSQGYVVEWRELRASHYGAPTIRKRLYLIARCDGKPIVWPEPTHGDAATIKALGRGCTLKPEIPVADCIDWSIPCHSIFLTKEQAKAVGVKRPLADATSRRLARGIYKFVIESLNPFIVSFTHQDGDRVEAIHLPFKTITGAHRGEKGLAVPFLSKFHAGKGGKGKNRNYSPDEAMPTQDASNRFALSMPYLVETAHGETCKQGKKRRGKGAYADNQPMGTIAGSNNHAIASAFLTEFANGSKQRNFSANEAMRTQCAEVKGGHFALCAAFLAKHYTGVTGSPVDKSIGTITSVDHHSMVAAHLSREFGNSTGAAAQAPMPTVMPGGQGKTTLVTTHLAATGLPQNPDPGPKTQAGVRPQNPEPKAQRLIAAHLMKQYGTTTGSAMADAMHTITGGGRKFSLVYAFLQKYYGQGGQDQAMTEPLHTVPTRDRFALVTVQGIEFAIADILIRMLAPRELYRGQGFPDSYVIDITITVCRPGKGGTRKVVRKPLSKEAQVRMCGNSVSPLVAEALVAANAPEMAVWRKGEREKFHRDPVAATRLPAFAVNQ